jgi:hypothetical protein
LSPSFSVPVLMLAPVFASMIVSSSEWQPELQAACRRNG